MARRPGSLRFAIRNQRGGLLVEMMVALTVLGIFMGMFATMQVDYFRRFNQLSTETGDLAGIRSIEEDILRDERYIMPQSTNPTLEAATLGEEALENSFGSAKTLRRCYDVDGKYLKGAKDEDCVYDVTLYKVAVLDRRLPADNSLAKVPVSRLNIRVSYLKEKDPLKNPKKEKAKVYISKLLTNVLPY